MAKPNASACENYGALSSAVSPPLDAASTVLSINEVLDSKPRLVPVSRGPLWKLIGDGTLETFTVGVRRYTTLAMIAKCNRKLIERGKNSSTRRRKHQERARVR